MIKSLIICLLLAGISCTMNSGEQTRLDADQTERLLQTDKTIQLVDLRTPEELLQTGKIAGARNINFNNPDFKIQIAQLDKTKPVLLYCASGGRSGKAKIQLGKMGFVTVYDYSGGMNDWKTKGKKTEQ